jgi:hypothetical protein
MKSIIMTLVLALSVSAQENLAKYDISMKMLGEIGKSTLTMHSSEDQYTIKMHIQMDKSLSDVEHSYESYGTIEDGIYLPEKFVKYIRKGDNEVTSYYVFDHDKREIQKYTTTKEEKFVLAQLFSSDEKVVTETFELITDFTANDTLTTFLNAETLLNGRSEMPVNSVGFRKDERNISLYKAEGEYKLAIVDKEAKDDYSILVSISPDGLVSNLVINEYTVFGTIVVARSPGTVIEGL